MTPAVEPPCVPSPTVGCIDTRNTIGSLCIEVPGCRVMNAAVALELAAPPCGTPEAAKSPYCINWQVVPCVSAYGYAQPVGCPLPPLKLQDPRP